MFVIVLQSNFAELDARRNSNVFTLLNMARKVAQGKSLKGRGKFSGFESGIYVVTLDVYSVCCSAANVDIPCA